jgi:hypothetical protein
MKTMIAMVTPGVGAHSRWRRRSRCVTVLVLALGLLGLTTAPAMSATEGPTTMSEGPAQRAATLLQEREARQAKRKSEAEQRRKEKIREREERAVHARELREAENVTHSRRQGSTSATCTGLTWNFEGFGPGTHSVNEIVTIDGTRWAPAVFTFEGPTGANTTPLELSPQTHSVDARASWVNDGERGGWDIGHSITCGGGGSSFGYEIEKRQMIAGSLTGWVTTPLTGEVGQTIEYEILVHNTGPEFVDFTDFDDPHCDPGTIKGDIEGPLAPNGTARDKCTHVITPADERAGSYSNTASVAGTPDGGDTPVTKMTNTVVVTVPPPTSQGGKGGSGGNSGQNNGTTSSNSSGSIGVLGSIGSSRRGLATTAVAPSLDGRPHACVRSSFVVSIKSGHVRRAVFYLDGHRLHTLTAKNARRGRLAVHVSVAGLQVGVHRVTVKITMSPLTASAKAVTATRSLAFARCAAKASPRFTG